MNTLAKVQTENDELMGVVQKKEEALVLGLDWHFFQPASIDEEYHFMLLGETCFWTLLRNQELAEKGIEEYGRFLTSEIFEANPWEATECWGDEWLLSFKSHVGGKGCWN